MEKTRDGEKLEKLKTSPWGWIHFLDILECSGPLSLIWTPAQEIITSLLKTIHFVFPIQLMTMRISRPLTLLVINSYTLYSSCCNTFTIFTFHPLEKGIFDLLWLPFRFSYIQNFPFSSNGQFLFQSQLPRDESISLEKGAIILRPFIKTLLLPCPGLQRPGWEHFIVVLYFINWIFEDTGANYRVQLQNVIKIFLNNK